MDQVDGKYQKLAHEYSKLRAQANVLKKAVVEEQQKGGQLKETIRLKEVDLRRSEQEVDSLTFRNKQLELRVATLQDELEKQDKQKRGLTHKNSQNGNQLIGGHATNNNSASSISSTAASVHNNGLVMDENVVAEEFQKKIIENAQLISLLADKSHELDTCQQSLQEVQEKVNNQLFKQSFVEEGLRQEIQELCTKNATLEMKLAEMGADVVLATAAAATRDDDNGSVTTENSSILADTAPISCATEDRVLSLEKELSVLRTRYEMLQLQGRVGENKGPAAESAEDAAGTRMETQEEVLFDHFSRKLDDVLLEKQLAESKLVSYLTECDSLKDHLEILTDKLRDQERLFSDSMRTEQILRDSLNATRMNYEEQISVLTEQILSLSDQLAAACN